MMMGKFCGILFGLMMLVGLCQGLSCHVCRTGDSDGGKCECDKVEAGKKSCATIECPPLRKPEKEKAYCSSVGKDGNWLRLCLELDKMLGDEKLGCRPAPEAPADLAPPGSITCRCDTDNCNGNNSTTSGSNDNKPNKNYYFIIILLFIILPHFFIYPYFFK